MIFFNNCDIPGLELSIILKRKIVHSKIQRKWSIKWNPLKPVNYWIIMLILTCSWEVGPCFPEHLALVANIFMDIMCWMCTFSALFIKIHGPKLRKLLPYTREQFSTKIPILKYLLFINVTFTFKSVATFLIQHEKYFFEYRWNFRDSKTRYLWYWLCKGVKSWTNNFWVFCLGVK